MYDHRFNRPLTMPVLNNPMSSAGADGREIREMGTVIDFSAETALRRPSLAPGATRCEGMGTVLILPVIRIERMADTTHDGGGPEEGAAPGRRRRRRARS
jgi:hypothetical protein